MKENDVNIAFEILLEEIELIANQLHESGAEAFRTGNYDKAKQKLEEASRLADFRGKVRALQREWANLGAGGLKVSQSKPRQTGRTRLMRGLRTPEEAFRRPILETLVEFGGRAPIGMVLERVGVKMKGILTQYDREPLLSPPHPIRWENTAR